MAGSADLWAAASGMPGLLGEFTEAGHEQADIPGHFLPQQFNCSVQSFSLMKEDRNHPEFPRRACLVS